MEIHAPDHGPAKIDADAVVVGLYSEGVPLGPAEEIDEATEGLITRLVKANEITGKANEVVSLLGPEGVKATQVVVVGLGERDKLDTGVAFQAAGAAAKTLATKSRDRVAFFLADDWQHKIVESAVAGAMVGSHGQDLYREKKNLHPPSELLFAGESAAVKAGQIIGQSVNFTRSLVNGPPCEIYPESFADQTAQMASECGLEVEVWDQERLEKERCGSLLAVSKGSSQPPRLVQLKHQGGKAGAPTLALVGKGVTFDSGGLSLKPSAGMMDMKCDMAGAATVVGAMQAIARLELPLNVMGLVGLVENMTGPAAYKLGDVLTARSGTTIEVLNTDAEGRLVLADVLDVARTSGASKIIDLATLTGACLVALGTDVAGLMTNDEEWCDDVAAAAESCGELVWQLPMFSLFDEQIKSEVADIKNIGKGRWGGTITAAKFLENFVGDVPWTHIDIAGPAFRDSAKPWCDAGASGELVRTLIEVARDWN